MKLLIIALAIPLLAQQKSVNFYSLEKERALGDTLAKDVRQQSKLLDNGEVQEYAKRVGAQMVGQLPEPQFTYTFEVIVSDATEPFALPGGHVFVPAQFFLTVKHEAEFATMMGHAVAHVALRHGTRSATRGQLVNASSIPLIYMGGWHGSHTGLSQGAKVLIPVGFLAHQRQQELEADKLGIELAGRCGYNAAAYRMYIQRVQQAEENATFSPLPNKEARIAKLDELLRDKSTELPVSSVAFTRAQDAVREALKKPEGKPPALRR
jgi:predicted Zn-dependent protease